MTTLAKALFSASFVLFASTAAFADNFSEPTDMNAEDVLMQQEDVLLQQQDGLVQPEDQTFEEQDMTNTEYRGRWVCAARAEHHKSALYVGQVSRSHSKAKRSAIRKCERHENDECAVRRCRRA